MGNLDALSQHATLPMYVIYMRHRVRAHIIQLEVEADSTYQAHRTATALRPDYLVTRIICNEYTCN